MHSYLVSTAGHAREQIQANPHDIETILQLIASGATELGDEKVVGFASKQDAWLCESYSFIELTHMSNNLAEWFEKGGITSDHVVSLLCPTGLDFLVAWIALMQLGCGVLFVAPQCSPSAISHLLQSTSSSQLVYHAKYSSLAHQSTESNHSVPILQLSLNYDNTSSDRPTRNVEPSSISHIFHTSGTSGTPKPIPNTHYQSVSVLPRRDAPAYISGKEPRFPSESAAFTTTPLFHGGVSDLLRAWMARSMIYFYPTSDTPITSRNVFLAEQACSSVDFEHKQGDRFLVTAFLSVPYILTILMEDTETVEMLRKMKLVSTGGAPLDTKVGNVMVQKGIKLVSRLGSSECGFLLSSHRDYDLEDDWEWLRNDSAYASALQFEPVGENYEMIVTAEWPSRTKTNRENGSYATGDLYERHSSKADVWRYAGRADDVIVMNNGEKASPGPVEAIFRSEFEDALVVGSDRQQLGLLLFSRPGKPHPDGLLTSLLQKANKQSPSFAQIAKEMCIVMSDSVDRLPKSSKGTVQRALAYQVFAETIDDLYTPEAEQLPTRNLEEIQAALRRIILDTNPGDLNDDTDLFNWGIDSLKATRIRAAIQKTINTGDQILPANIVFEKPSLKMLSQYIFALQKGRSDDTEVSRTQQMMDLATKYGTFSAQNKRQSSTRPVTTILLTGATGELGSALLHRLSSMGYSIICLVRAETDSAAQSRVASKLESKGLEGSKFISLASSLVEPQLGLDSAAYHDLVVRVDVVIHAAWPVHFASSLGSFEDSIKGTRHLIDFVQATNNASFYFCSSLASILDQTSETLLETISNDASTATSLGYSQSKWVTERICSSASVVIQGRIHILRWNEKEGWPLMIRTAQSIGCLPLLNECPSWLPVDCAANIIADIVTTKNDELVYHVVNPHTITWNAIMDGLHHAGLKFDRVAPEEWLARVASCPDDDPSKRMLWLWKEAYGPNGGVSKALDVDISNARSVSPSLRALAPIDNVQIAKMVNAWRETGFLI